MHKCGQRLVLCEDHDISAQHFWRVSLRTCVYGQLSARRTLRGLRHLAVGSVWSSMLAIGSWNTVPLPSPADTPPAQTKHATHGANGTDPRARPRANEGSCELWTSEVSATYAPGAQRGAGSGDSSAITAVLARLFSLQGTGHQATRLHRRRGASG